MNTRLLPENDTVARASVVGVPSDNIWITFVSDQARPTFDVAAPLSDAEALQTWVVPSEKP